jgi:hypothetical protein
MATAVSAVGHDMIGLAQRQVELLRNIQASREEYQRNQEQINRSLSAGTFIAPSPPTVGNDHTNGHHVKPAQRTPLRKISVKGLTKSAFVEACFRSDPGTPPKMINALWVNGGGEGTISPSLVYNTKRDIRDAASKFAPRSLVARGLSAPMTKGKKTRKTATAITTDQIDDIRQAIWAILQQRSMNVGDLSQAIQEGELIDPVPRQLNIIVRDLCQELRNANKLTRGDGRRYEIKDGATLE